MGGDSTSWFAQIGMGLAGAYFGGFTGMMIGMSVAGVLFNAEESKENPMQNTFTKSSQEITRPDPVPVVIGTDISPGYIIYMSGRGYLDSASFLGNTTIYHFDANSYLNLDFLVNFACEGWYSYGVNQVWINEKHHWYWLAYNDYMHYQYGWFTLGWSNVTTLQLNRYWSGLTPGAEEQWTPLKRVTPSRWRGCMFEPFPVFYSGSNDPELIEKIVTECKPPEIFPTFKAEISSGSIGVQTQNSTKGISPYSGVMAGDRSHSGYSITYRDSLNENLYGLSAATDIPDWDQPWEDEAVDFRRLNFYAYTYTRLMEKEDFYNNISRGYRDSQRLIRQDIDGNPDHLYFLHGRNWFNAGTYDHHHANYSLQYDIYYLDRSDDTIHSVVKDKTLYFIGEDKDSTSIPRIKVDSMEVVGDHILLFGKEYQTHSIWHERRYLTADTEDLTSIGCTKIYADLSTYPEGYWVNDFGQIYVWAYFRIHADGRVVDYREKYKIIEQTKTYIVVDGIYALKAKEGDIVYITRVREYQAQWTYVGEGSTKSTIIGFIPEKKEPPITNVPYNALQFNEGWQSTGSTRWGFQIGSIDGSRINLATPLAEDPIVGDIVWFSNQNTPEEDDKDELDDYLRPFSRFFNPYNYWFLDNLMIHWYYPRIASVGPLPIVAPLGSNISPYDYNFYGNVGLQNSNGWGKSVVLKINKTTGEFEGVLYQADYLPYRYTGIQFICVSELNQINSVSTDAQFCVSFQNAYPYAYLWNHSVVFDKATLSIVSASQKSTYGQVNTGHAWYADYGYFHSHACGRVFRGCVKVRAFHPINGYSYRWYAFCYEFSNVTSGRNGAYLLDLGEEGIFPDALADLGPPSSEIYSSMLNMDADEPGMIKWYRADVATGPLYSPFYLETASSRNESPNMRIYDYDEKLIFTFDRGSVGISQGVEVWCFKLPNEYNHDGFSWPIYSNAENWSDGQSIEYGDQHISNKYYVGTSTSSHAWHGSNYCDSNITETLRRFLGSSFTMDIIEREYADEIIGDKVLYAGNEKEINEPRFMFSKTYAQKTKITDIIQEILATCQGILVTHCSKSYKYQVKFPKSNEPVEWYFGFDEQWFVTNQSSANNDIIYADFSNYPDNYWRGDSGYIIKNGTKYSFEVENSYFNRIELLVSMPISTALNDQFTIIKDNMIEHSFAYSKKPQYGRSNRVRLEFVNRLMNYVIDIAETDYHYKQDIVDKRVILRHWKMHGIKRATQAARMSLRYLDYEQFVNWMCSFQTDFLGSYLCIGDIIAVTHPVTNWFQKKFRVIKKSETDIHNTTVECEEYIGNIYHDYSHPVYQGGGGGTTGNQLPLFDAPDPIRRLYVHYDYVSNRFYVSFAFPVSSSFVIGAKVYYKINDGEYELLGTSLNSSTSVIYSSTGTSEPSDMEPTRTKYNEMCELGYQYTEIPYDPLTMIGTFPASGYLWVNNELIYYNEIDTINNKFLNCIRCIDVPDYQYAVDAPDDGYSWTNPLIILADPTTFNFNFDKTAINIDYSEEKAQTEGSQIEYNLPVITFKVQTLSAGLTESVSYPTFQFQLKSALDRPLSPTLLRYVRDL